MPLPKTLLSPLNNHQSLTLVLQRLGLSSLSSHLPKVSSSAALVLAGKATCQDEDGDEIEDEASAKCTLRCKLHDSDSSRLVDSLRKDDEAGNVELEEEVLAAACDLLPAIAAAVGPAAYAEVFAKDHLPHLLTRCDKSCLSHASDI